MRYSLLPVLLALPLVFNGTAVGRTQEKQEKTITVTSRSSRQGWLGVEIQDLNAKTAKKKNLKSEEGSLVTKVTEKSPAEKAGLKAGDVVVEFNGRTIYDSEDLTKAVQRTKPGTTVPVIVQRDADRKTFQVTIAKRKNEGLAFFNVAPRAMAVPHIRMMQHSSTYGLSMQDLNSQLGAYFGAPDGKGVLVEEVEKESDAEKAGFKAGDVIIRIGKESVEDIEDVQEALHNLNDGEKAEVEVLRKGSKMSLTLTISEEELSDVYRFDVPEPPEPVDLDIPGEHHPSHEFRLQLEGLREQIRESMKPGMRELKKNLESLRESIRHQAGRTIHRQMEGATMNLKRELHRTTI
jgi:predicted metalloprotease with PDZ domain